MSLAHRALAWIGLTGYLLWEVLLSGLRVAWEVLTPRSRARPGIIRVPLDLERTSQITLLSHLVTLTPGTVSLDVTPSKDALYVHVMFLDDIDAETRSIKDGLETWVRRVMP